MSVWWLVPVACFALVCPTLTKETSEECPSTSHDDETSNEQSSDSSCSYQTGKATESSTFSKSSSSSSDELNSSSNSASISGDADVVEYGSNMAMKGGCDKDSTKSQDDSTPVCDGGEVYQKCGTACEDTCDNYQDNNRICTANCVEGCFCQKGFVRGPENKCIKPQNCSKPSDQCGKNEVYSKCKITCPPQTCAGRNGTYNCPLQSSSTCKPGCNFKDGFVRNGTTTDPCIPSGLCPPTKPQCPVNEEIGECVNDCLTTCKTRYRSDNRSCTADCRPGCKCIAGYLRDDSGNCVPINQCSVPLCDSDEVYNPCGSACEKTCNSNDDTSKLCTKQCVDGCFCPEGLVRAADGSCIEQKDCPPPAQQCSKNEVPTDCFNECFITTCKTRFRKPKFCPQYCVKGCTCAPGYLKHNNGTCVLEKQCSTPICDGGEVYQKCGTACEDTCDNYQDNDRVCTANCVEGCFCQKGLVRGPENKCIKRQSCSSPEICGKNEVWSECKSVCPPQTCISLYAKFKCAAEIPCIAGCNCIEGYLRSGNSSTSCIPANKCPNVPADDEFLGDWIEMNVNTIREQVNQQLNKDSIWKQADFGYPPIDTCGKNEFYVVRSTICEYSCEDKRTRAKICKPFTGCICQAGYLRDDTGMCVWPRECGKSKKCGKNEVFHKCRVQCPPQTCASIYTLYNCIANQTCEPGCDCKPNYLRNGTDTDPCILSKLCPPQQTCGANEVATDCYSPCSKTCKTRFRNDQVCSDVCYKGCNCINGYLKHDNGTCVPERQCSPPKCNDDEYFPKCGPSCEDTCADFNNTCRICTRRCATGCFCKPGTVRGEDGVTCVKKENCPIPTCGPNQHYEVCPPTCPPQTCRARTARYDCTAIRQCCQPQCRCNDGYTRNDDGECVESDKC